MKNGLFITIEGPDGAGKTTQIDNIERYFAERGRTVVRTREPGGTSIGEKLRAVLLDPANTEMSPITEMLIYAAARAQHVAEKIRPAIDRGDVVICDRFMDSSIAYQGYGRGLGECVRDVNLIAVDGVLPDITFLMDLDPAKGLARIAANRGTEDRLEREALDFHYRIYEGFLALCDEPGTAMVRIDADRTVEEIKADIYAKLDEIVTG